MSITTARLAEFVSLSQAAETMIENVSAMLSSALSEYSGTDSPASVCVDKKTQTDLVIRDVIAAVLDTY